MADCSMLAACMYGINGAGLATLRSVSGSSNRNDIPTMSLSSSAWPLVNALCTALHMTAAKGSSSSAGFRRSGARSAYSTPCKNSAHRVRRSHGDASVGPSMPIVGTPIQLSKRRNVLTNVATIDTPASKLLSSSAT
jgi:hypothetical protein